MNMFNIKKLTMPLIMLFTIAVSANAYAASAPSAESEPEKGPNNGKMLKEGTFTLELALFERGVPPEYRVWCTYGGAEIDPGRVEVKIGLTRLGGVVDDIKFRAEGDYLRGDTVIYEPHSFIVDIIAKFDGQTYTWNYDNFEGRTEIESKVATAMEIRTEKAGSAVIHQAIPVYGKLALLPQSKRDLYAKFDGNISNVLVAQGEVVKKGQTLIKVESNTTLRAYDIKSPMDGVVLNIDLNEGEQTMSRSIMTIVNNDTLRAELMLYPEDWGKVKLGSTVTLSYNGIEDKHSSIVGSINPMISENQARVVRVLVDNKDGLLSAGLFVSAQVEVATVEVPLAVKRNALQAFRDFTVVYSKFGETYEVRMLELGRVGTDWIEVLGGIKEGTEYVTENSYIIKADIEKSGASHDH